MAVIKEFDSVRITHRPDQRSLLHRMAAMIHRGYPSFVYDNRIGSFRGQLPVFTFHSVEPDRFESQLKYLKENGYETLTADAFEAILNRDMPLPERAVLLTFDDGLASLWSTAYPLLKKYESKAVAFVIPGLVPEGDVPRPNLDDGARTGRPADDKQEKPLLKRFCTWGEIRTMQQSGVIDIQSHSLHHARIFVSPRVSDFFSPNYAGAFPKFGMPVYRESGRDRWDRPGLYGMPLYESRPLLAGQPRYFDDENLRRLCIDHVARHGGSEYFSGRGSFRQLDEIVKAYRSRHGEQGRFETEEEQDRVLLEELESSKRILEEKLQGHRVRHFCYPWWSGSDRAVELSKTVGYRTNFWGRLPWRRTNRPGDDPFYGVRLRERYLFRLPGIGRRSLVSVLTGR
jgi:peptidoglycan/xylan/chitin deacetylase (PgdA/CDA1 family)